jgi:hypothetical protein
MLQERGYPDSLPHIMAKDPEMRMRISPNNK